MGWFRSVLASCAIFADIFCASLAVSVADTVSELRIAAILPLSGEAASIGAACRNGMIMALDSLPEQTRNKLDITYEDDGLVPARSISALNKIMSQGRVDLVLNLSSGTAKALVTLTEAKRIPFLAVASDYEVGKGRTYAFNFWVTPEEEVRVLIPEMKRRGYKRIARIHTTQSGVLYAKDVFDRLNAGAIDIVLSEDYDPDVKDFRTFLTKLRAKEKETDAVMIFLMPGQLHLFARQMREMGIFLPLFGAEMFEDAQEVALARGALDGAWYVNAGDGDGTFLQGYRQRFPGASSFGAANCHDAVMLAARAEERGVARERLHEYLATLEKFSGALGTYSATGDQRFSLPAALKVVTKDGFETIAR